METKKKNVLFNISLKEKEIPTQIFFCDTFESRARGTVTHEHGAHRDCCRAGFFLSNFELAGLLY